MNDNELNLKLKESLKNDNEPTASVNLALINAAKVSSNQAVSAKDFRKSVLVFLILTSPVAVMLTVFIVLFVVTSVTLKIIILANMIWGLLLTGILGFLGSRLVEKKRGASFI